MGWRHILISNPSKISIENEQLLISQSNKVSIPLEDISTIIIENNYSIITTYALSKISSYNIALYTCNESHMPNGILTSFNNHSRQLSVIEMQFNLSKPIKKRIWQSIVISKLQNQSKCLEYLKKDGVVYILNFSKNVESGDKSNREACGARAYFKNLFGKSFKRDNEDILNASLNYGYSILRGCIARTLIRYGLNPCIGINHHSELNNFNLADDFIEPFRPIVDLYVASNINERSERLDYNIKKGLYSILNYEINISETTQSIDNAIDIMIKSFVSSCRSNDYKQLKLPDLIPIKLHSYE